MPTADAGADADDVDDVRKEFAATLDAIERTVDPTKRVQDVTERVKDLARDKPVPMAAIAIAGAAVLALAAVIVYRVTRR